MNTLPVMYVGSSWIILPALSCLHLSTQTHHRPTHSHCICIMYMYLSVLWSCASMFVSLCLSAILFVLSCPVVLACQPITDMIEWAGSGCIQGWLIWGWWPTWSHCITPFELLFSVWQLIQNTQLWLVESLWGFRLHTFHSVWSFEHVASWEQDLAVMNLNWIWYDLEMTRKWKCYDTVNCYWSHTNVRSSTR